MPNGNTLITEAMEGRIFEVTSGGTIVWTYFAGAAVHKAPRYWAISTGVETPPPAVRLLAATPNPFNPVTRIHFDIAFEQHVSLEIFDLGGRHMMTLAARIYPRGNHTVEWNGRDDEGRSVPSGTFVVRLKTDNGEESRLITLVR